MKSKENAVPQVDYVPLDQKIEFASGESMKIISIDLFDLNEEPEEETAEDFKAGGINTSVNEGSAVASEVSNRSSKKKKKDEDEDAGPKFKVIIEKAEPAGVKISKKNCCTVEIKDGYIDEVLEEEQNNLIKYYVAQKQKNSWKDQFVQACMLSPVVDDDNLVVS